MSRRQGEERAPAERQAIYMDPNLAKRKRKEAADLRRRYNQLCGEVTVTKIPDGSPSDG